MATVSYTEARARLADLLDQVTDDRETVIVNRRGHEPVAMIAADELDALLETVHLLRSRTNAERLLTSLARAKSREGSETSLDVLKAELELDEG
jgi:antitoxin YefM